jgi:glycosyltransferase involved in cell wall biosynthesis
MERFNFELITELKKLCNLQLIATGKNRLYFPLFLFQAFIRGLYYCIREPVELIYVSDGLLSPLAVVFKAMFGLPIAVTIHGRDIAFDHRVYQWLIGKCLMKMDQVFCVSTYLKDECIKRGVRGEMIQVIPNGIRVNDFNKPLQESDRKRIEEIVSAHLWNSTQKRPILLSVGRLVPKKGIDYFVSEILPRIVTMEPNLMYFIVGDGPLRQRIEQIAEANNTTNNIHFFGAIGMSDDTLNKLYKCADIFIMPNVPVAGDAEGFGIVILEACAAGLPVVASRVDGISEVIYEGINGFLIDSNDKGCFTETIMKLLRDPGFCSFFGRRAEEFVRSRFDWPTIASSYFDAFSAFLSANARLAAEGHPGIQSAPR